MNKVMHVFFRKVPEAILKTTKIKKCNINKASLPKSGLAFFILIFHEVHATLYQGYSSILQVDNNNYKSCNIMVT